MSRYLFRIEKTVRLPALRWPKWRLTRQQRHFVMRHWDIGEFGSSGNAWTMRNTYDGTITNLQYDNTTYFTTIKNLVSEGKLFWRYMDAFKYPFSVREFGTGARWEDYYRHNWQFSGSAAGSPTKYRMILSSRTPDIVACMWAHVSRTYQERNELVPLMLFSESDLRAVATKMVSLARDLTQDGSSYLLPGAGVFTDNCYLDIRYWMIPTNNTYGSGHGNTSETPPYLATTYYVDPTYWTDWTELESVFGNGGTWATYTQRYTYFTNYVQSLVSASGQMGSLAPWRIANCAYSGPINGYQHAMPWYIENVFGSFARTYADSLTAWKQDFRNVISARCAGLYPLYTLPDPATWTQIQTLLNEWQASGGWIGFTDDGSVGGIAQREQAYSAAADIRAKGM